MIGTSTPVTGPQQWQGPHNQGVQPSGYQQGQPAIVAQQASHFNAMMQSAQYVPEWTTHPQQTALDPSGPPADNRVMHPSNSAVRTGNLPAVSGDSMDAPLDTTKETARQATSKKPTSASDTTMKNLLKKHQRKMTDRARYKPGKCSVPGCKTTFSKWHHDKEDREKIYCKYHYNKINQEKPGECSVPGCETTFSSWFRDKEDSSKVYCRKCYDKQYQKKRQETRKRGAQ
jgi:hypothetical protein